MRILFVCLGNICRSPTAEGVLRDFLTREAPQLAVEIDSAGTGDFHIGAPTDPRSQRAALRRGIDLSALRARQVSPEDFSRFDWILAMDEDNLRDLEAIRPAGSQAQLRLFLDFAPPRADSWPGYSSVNLLRRTIKPANFSANVRRGRNSLRYH